MNKRRIILPKFCLLIVVVFITIGIKFANAEAQTAGITSELNSYIRDLSDSNYQIRWKALEALAKLGPKAAPAVPTLIDRLEEKDDHYRAIDVLGAIGPAAVPAVPALLRHLEHDLSVKDKLYKDESTNATGIIETLAEIGPTAKEAIPLLQQALKDENSTIRYFAAYALGEMGSAATVAIPDLKNLLIDHDYVGSYDYPYGKDVSEAAAQTLHQLGTAIEKKVEKQR